VQVARPSPARPATRAPQAADASGLAERLTAAARAMLSTPSVTRTGPLERFMDLALWIPLTIGLGLAALALMALFVWFCDQV
jgi:hypothetical protein